MALPVGEAVARAAALAAGAAQLLGCPADDKQLSHHVSDILACCPQLLLPVQQDATVPLPADAAAAGAMSNLQALCFLAGCTPEGAWSLVRQAPGLLACRDLRGRLQQLSLLLQLPVRDVIAILPPPELEGLVAGASQRQLAAAAVAVNQHVSPLQLTPTEVTTVMRAAPQLLLAPAGLAASGEPRIGVGAAASGPLQQLLTWLRSSDLGPLAAEEQKRLLLDHPRELLARAAAQQQQLGALGRAAAVAADALQLQLPDALRLLLSQPEQLASDIAGDPVACDTELKHLLAVVTSQPAWRAELARCRAAPVRQQLQQLAVLLRRRDRSHVLLRLVEARLAGSVSFAAALEMEGEQVVQVLSQAEDSAAADAAAADVAAAAAAAAEEEDGGAGAQAQIQPSGSRVDLEEQRLSRSGVKGSDSRGPPEAVACGDGRSGSSDAEQRQGQQQPKGRRGYIKKLSKPS